MFAGITLWTWSLKRTFWLPPKLMNISATLSSLYFLDKYTGYFHKRYVIYFKNSAHSIPVRVPPVLVQVHESERLDCNTGHQEVSRCCTRGESEESVAFTRWNRQVRVSTLALNPKVIDTRNPKHGYQLPHKKDWCPPEIKTKCFYRPLFLI